MHQQQWIFLPVESDYVRNDFPGCERLLAVALWLDNRGCTLFERGELVPSIYGKFWKP
jgi:hypothetical protein